MMSLLDQKITFHGFSKINNSLNRIRVTIEHN